MPLTHQTSRNILCRWNGSSIKASFQTFTSLCSLLSTLLITFMDWWINWKTGCAAGRLDHVAPCEPEISVQDLESFLRHADK